MGSRIAAHFANAGFPVHLLDIVIPGQPNRNAAALAGIENAARQKPVAFFTDAAKSLIRFLTAPAATAVLKAKGLDPG